MKKLLWIIKLSCFILCSYHGHSCPEDIVKLIPDSSVREELDKNGIMSTFSQQENLYLASKINKELIQIKNTNNTTLDTITLNKVLTDQKKKVLTIVVWKEEIVMIGSLLMQKI